MHIHVRCSKSIHSRISPNCISNSCIDSNLESKIKHNTKTCQMEKERHPGVWEAESCSSMRSVSWWSSWYSTQICPDAARMSHYYIRRSILGSHSTLKYGNFQLHSSRKTQRMGLIGGWENGLTDNESTTLDRARSDWLGGVLANELNVSWSGIKFVKAAHQFANCGRLVLMTGGQWCLDEKHTGNSYNTLWRGLNSGSTH